MGGQLWHGLKETISVGIMAIQQQQRAQSYRVQTNIDCTEFRARRTSLLSADEVALPGKIKYEYGIKNED